MVTNLRYADDTTLLAETKEDLIELVERVRRANEKAGVYLNVGNDYRIHRIVDSWVQSHRRRFESWASSFTPRCLSLNECVCMRTSMERSECSLMELS